MKFTIILTLLIFTIQSCLLNADKKQGQTETILNNLERKGPKNPRDTNKIEIYKDHFIVTTDGSSKRADSELELLNILKAYKSNDFLYLTIKDATSIQIESALERLHELKLKNYKVEITDDYFKLPR